MVDMLMAELWCSLTPDPRAVMPVAAVACPSFTDRRGQSGIIGVLLYPLRQGSLTKPEARLAVRKFQ